MKTTLIQLLCGSLLMSVLLAQDTQVKQHEARVDFQNALIYLRNAEKTGDKKQIAIAQRNMMQAQYDYKVATRNHLYNRMKGKSDKTYYLYKERSRLAEERYNHNNALLKYAENDTSHMSAKKLRESMASNEAMLRMKMIQDEVNEQAIRQRVPTAKRFYQKTATVHDQKVDSKVARMGELLRSIESNNYNRSYYKGHKGEVDKMMKKAQYERNMREYRALAQAENYRDPVTGNYLSPQMQKNASNNAMIALEQQMKRYAHHGGLPEEFVNIVSGRKKDSRLFESFT